MKHGEAVGGNGLIQRLNGITAAEKEIGVFQVERIKELIRLCDGLLRLSVHYTLHLRRGIIRDGSSEIVVQFLELRASVNDFVTADEVATVRIDVATHVGAASGVNAV